MIEFELERRRILIRRWQPIEGLHGKPYKIICHSQKERNYVIVSRHPAIKLSHLSNGGDSLLMQSSLTLPLDRLGMINPCI